MANIKPYFEKVERDRYDEVAQVWCIDAYRTYCADEEKKTVAIVNDNGGVWWLEKHAKYCPNVIETINALLRDLRKRRAIVPQKKEVVKFYLNEEEHPRAYKHILSQLTEKGGEGDLVMSEEDARDFIKNNPIEMILLFSDSSDLFGIENFETNYGLTKLCNPYDGLDVKYQMAHQSIEDVY